MATYPKKWTTPKKYDTPIHRYDANDYARVEQDVKKISSYIDKPVLKKEVA